MEEDDTVSASDGCSVVDVTPSHDICGIGRPLLGYRNWPAYAQARDGPDTRFVVKEPSLRVNPAYHQAKLLQRWQPDLMLDPSVTMPLLKEDWEKRRTWQREDMLAQGNALWTPPAPGAAPGIEPSPWFLVHAGGPVMDQLHLSWLDEGLEEAGGEDRAEESPGYPLPALRVGTGRVSEVGPVAQIAPLNQ